MAAAAATSPIPSLARRTTSRAVYLRLTPRPSNLGESREMLRVLQQFGEVEHFKNLRYDVAANPNAALAIFRDDAAAKECLRRSPVRFRMTRVGVQQERQAQNGDREGGIEAQGDDPADHGRLFQIQASTAGVNFRDRVNDSHFYGPFAIDSKSIAQQDLVQRVPTRGLSDLNSRAQYKPSRVVARENKRDGAFRGSGPRRERRTLLQLWEEGAARDGANHASEG